ncbi:hypothetical protein [Nitrosopumilus sp.]|uniref:hypothetical protein n=1 Tax=Nitrosopumilus sp. TaxID=2024843 RepID=UPI002606D024|nr:hypothetical protein [Nitrosopumilus sp.]
MLNWFNEDTNQIGNNMTLAVEIFLGTLIAVIAHKQNQQTNKVSQFLDNQVNYVKEDIGRCLVNIFATLYPSTSLNISELEAKRLTKNEISSNLQTIEFHHSNNSMYLEAYTQNGLSSLISQMKRINDGHPGIFPLLNNIILSLERNFPNRYTQEIDYLLQDFIKKISQKYPNLELRNLSLYNPNAQQPYLDFITEKIYDVKSLPNWILTHLKFPGIEVELNSFKTRTENRIESLQHVKNNKTVKNLDSEEIDFLIELYSNALKIFKITHTNEINPNDLKVFIENLKLFVEKYGNLMKTLY